MGFPRSKFCSLIVNIAIDEEITSIIKNNSTFHSGIHMNFRHHAFSELHSSELVPIIKY